MLRVVLAGLLFLASNSVLAFQFPIEMIEGVDGARVIINIKKEDLDNDVRWVPFDGAPPLAIKDVLDVVKTHQTETPTMKGATLKEIQLRRIPHHERNWHYMVVMQTMNEDKPVLHYYVVLMSGKLIPAIHEPESYK